MLLAKLGRIGLVTLVFILSKMGTNPLPYLTLGLVFAQNRTTDPIFFCSPIVSLISFPSMRLVLYGFRYHKLLRIASLWLSLSLTGLKPAVWPPSFRAHLSLFVSRPHLAANLLRGSGFF